MEFNINICVENKCTTTEKGKLLEDLTAQIMKAQQYSVVKTIRVTGMELDLLAKHNYSGEEIIVECKAWEDNLPGDVITKLLGNVLFNDVSSGWLVTTGGLGKDAEGLKDTWEKKPIEDRRKLIFYTSDRIVNLLIDNRVIVNPECLVSKIPSGIYCSNRCTLLITNLGMFWLFPGSTVTGSIATTVMVFDSSCGNRINDLNTLKKLKSIKSVFSKYDWIADEQNNKETQKINDEFENIATVICGDAWTDYRPARPEDYVGRRDLIKNILGYFVDVQNRNTEMRLFSIKSPSGWGKSSSIIKLIHEVHSSRKKNGFFMYAVDVRTAMSSRYAELAFKSCLESALAENFINIGKNKIDVGDVSDVTSSTDVQRILEKLKEENKVIILIFDQFEEIFYKQELFELFENMRRISNTIDSIKENIVLGYAWKTDFSIPSDHPAYYLWSNLQERRKEFDLLQFTEGEIKSAINVFSKELGQKINPVLSRYLTRQCQGYPWLLKKLCIHVFNVVNEGHKQEEAIKQTLNIGDLFENEINSLSSDEYACVQLIAKESPADYFRIVETFGQSTLQALINRRTVIKRSTKLTLYWDIFRDYVLTSKLPDIIIEYMPQVQFTTFIRVLLLLLESETTIEISSLVEKSLLGKKTIDNILIDLTMFGLISREKDGVRIKTTNSEKISQDIQDFFQKHVVYRTLQKANLDSFTSEEYSKVFNSIYTIDNLSQKTQKIYALRLLGWLVDTKLVTDDKGKYNFNYKHENLLLVDSAEVGKRRRIIDRNYLRRKKYTKVHMELYWPQVSPNKIKDFYTELTNDNQNSTILVSHGYKKVIEDLISLDAISITNQGKVNLHLELTQLYDKVKKMKDISFAVAELTKNPSCTIRQMGSKINDAFEKNWSTATMRVTGGMIYRWAKEFLV